MEDSKLNRSGHSHLSDQPQKFFQFNSEFMPFVEPTDYKAIPF